MKKFFNILNPLRILRYLGDILRNAIAVSRQYGVSVFTIVREQISLNLRNGMRRDEYYKYHLFDRELSWEQKCAFVSDVEIKAIQCTLNPSEYYNVFKNKLQFKTLFVEAEIPLSKLYGLWEGEGNVESGTLEVRSGESTVNESQSTDHTSYPTSHVPRPTLNCLRCVEDVQSLIDGLPEGEGVVFKPVEGSEGQMVMVFSTTEGAESTEKKGENGSEERERAESRPLGVESGESGRLTVGSEDAVSQSTVHSPPSAVHSPYRVLVSVSGERVSAEMLVRRLSDRVALKRAYSGGEIKTAFLVEAYVRGHSDLACLCGKTLCTCRIVTLVKDDGEVDFLGAVFKLAPSDAGVDNLHAGGMSVGVNVETGVLQKGRTMADMWRPYRTALADGTEFTGVKLPFWSETIDVVKKAALVFPQLPCVGWDVAITEDGPVVIEGNWGWAADLMQIGMHRGVMTEALRTAVE